MLNAIRLGLLTILLCLIGLPAHAGEETTAYRPKVFRLAFASYAGRRACFLFGGQINSAPAQADPLTISLLQRIADQQQAMALQMQIQAQQSRPVQTDPSLLTTLAQIAAQQERIISAINDGKVQDAATQGLLREMINGQQQLLLAIQRPSPMPPPPPIIITPPTPTPPIVITPPPAWGVPAPGGSLPSLPPAGGIQALPGPGGSLQLIPPAGGSIQALPGPGGSLQILPGGVAPPAGTRPPSGPMQSLPGGGILIPIPDGTLPGMPLPGAGGGPGIIPVKGPLKPIRYSYAIYYPPGR